MLRYEVRQPGVEPYARFGFKDDADAYCRARRLRGGFDDLEVNDIIEELTLEVTKLNQLTQLKTLFRNLMGGEA